MSHYTQLNKEQFGPWALVTGASSGLGLEFARQLARSGFKLVLAARRIDLLENLGKHLQREYGIDYRTLGIDLSEPDFIKTIEAATHDLDIGLVISNAGTGKPGAFLNHSHDHLRRIMRLNAASHLDLTYHFGQRLAKRGKGGVLLISAMGATHGLPYMASDAASKSFVASLGAGLHLEFKKLGLNITSVLIGPTDTPIIDTFGLDIAKMPVKPMTVERTVAEALAAFKANRPTWLTGRMNRLMDKLVPDSLKRRILGNMLSAGARANGLL
jgi:short-subunit dehydrogenase